MKNNKKSNVVHIRPVESTEKKPVIKKVQKKNIKHSQLRYGIIIVFMLALYLAYMNIGVFVNATITKIHTEDISSNNRYLAFGNNILRYGKDGMGVLNKNGTELWNAPYQISNPLVTMTGESLVIADRNGNKIMVMDQDGIKGEIEAALPIEKVSVSRQGIVAALLKDDKSSKVVCYDAVGNILAELMVSLTSVGYPLDVGISYDGTLIFTTYLQYNEGTINTTYRCYNLASAEATSTEKIIIEETLNGVLAPSTFFMDENTAVVVSDSGLYLYDTSNQDFDCVSIALEKEIGQIFYSEGYLGVMLKGTNTDVGNEIRIYNSKGKQISSMIYQGEYSNIEIIDNQIVLYDGTRCIIYKMSGREVFEGTFDVEVSAILPKFGINKYLVVGKDSIVDIRLKR